jgi:hypothetical protein
MADGWGKVVVPIPFSGQSLLREGYNFLALQLGRKIDEDDPRTSSIFVFEETERWVWDNSQ